ncbi:MAG: plasmid mobilization relaxosome protein MobC [Hyphomicrobiaceae bacterium]|nr:plasmid mobilization relaxosome protein MobC [Hyphomicrobiaceae bacterium]
MTFSALVADVLDAHVAGTRLQAPHPRGQDAATLRELARIGNNVNQIAREAHLMNLPLIVAKAAQTLDALHAAVDRIGS